MATLTVVTNVSNELQDRHRTFRAKRDSVIEVVIGHALRKREADPECRRQIGAAVEQAIKSVGSSVKEVASQLGYKDHSTVSRWISGAETANFAKLWEIVDLRCELVLALAHRCGGMRIMNMVTFARQIDGAK